ncbi:MAG: hypothetical protein HOV79_07990 [Hamadaea sp.]|nr:hypothetical protein [Hamadaea sp.]
MKLRIGRYAVGTAVLVAAALALGACGGSGDDASGGGGDAQSAYTKCLADNGVTLPSGMARPSGGARPSGMPTDRPTARPSGTAFPGGGGQNGGPGSGFMPQGVDATAWAKAQEACAALRPSGQPGFGGGGQGPGQGGAGREAAYRNCLAEQGVTIQDGQEPDTSDAKVAAAVKACAVLKPSAGPSS